MMWAERLKDLEKDNLNENVSVDSPVKDFVGSHDNDMNSNNTNPYYVSYRGLAGLGVGFASIFAELVISHPFVVIRHQCQVRSSSQQLHILPFSLISVVKKYVSNQGLGSLWKGLGSILTVEGFAMASENLISEFTFLPREITKHSSINRMFSHLLLKAISRAMATPLFAASVVETVQSDTASEPTTLFSCIREAFHRLFHCQMPAFNRYSLFKSSSASFSNNSYSDRSSSLKVRVAMTSTSHLLPIWRLIPPYVMFGLLHYAIRRSVCFAAQNYLRGYEDEDELAAEIEHNFKASVNDINRQTPSPVFDDIPMGRAGSAASGGTRPDDWTALQAQRQETALHAIYNKYYNDLLAGMMANMAADVVCFPLETLLFRLCVQGTRTLVDNLDTGVFVVSVSSRYSGFTDALSVAMNQEVGVLGLYRGFGALIAQYALQYAFLCGVRYVYEHLLYTWMSNSPGATAPSLLGTTDYRSRSQSPFWMSGSGSRQRDLPGCNSGNQLSQRDSSLWMLDKPVGDSVSEPYLGSQFLPINSSLTDTMTPGSTIMQSNKLFDGHG